MADAVESAWEHMYEEAAHVQRGASEPRITDDLNNLSQRMRPSAIAMVVSASRDLDADRITAGHDFIEQISAYLQSNRHLRDPKESKMIAAETEYEHLRMDHDLGVQMLQSLLDLNSERDKTKHWYVARRCSSNS